MQAKVFLGEKISKYRKRKRLTLDQFAALIAESVDPSRVSKWENELVAPGGKHLPRLLEVLEIDEETYANSVGKKTSSRNPRKISQDLDGAAANVKFWHTIAERQEHRKDVRGLINTAKKRVVISGIALEYVVRKCD